MRIATLKLPNGNLGFTHLVTLEKAWIIWVRDWRKRKDLTSPLNPEPFDDKGGTTTEEDDDW